MYPAVQIEPFVEQCDTMCRVGYRTVANGQTISSLEIPSRLLEQTIGAGLSIDVSMSCDGRITVSDPHSRSNVVPLDELVLTLLAEDNLRMEEPTVTDLQSLLNRLQQCVHAVELAIESLTSMRI